MTTETRDMKAAGDLVAGLGLAVASGLLLLAATGSAVRAAGHTSCDAIAEKPLYGLFPSDVLAACPGDDAQARLQKARAAVQANNAEKIEQYGRPLFNSNTSAALPLLGAVVEGGIGQPVDLNEAFFVYRAASADGVPTGAAGYGRVALRSKDLARLKPEAVEALEEAIIAGDPSAFETMAEARYTGNYIGQSWSEARRLAQSGAELGHPGCQYLLGSWYVRGGIVTRDRGRALTLFDKAAAAGEPRALFALGRLISSPSIGERFDEERAVGHLLDGYVRTASPRERQNLYRQLRRFDRQSVRFEVQRQLNAAGLDTGGVDGALGKKTAAALEAYRAQRYTWPDEGAALEEAGQ